MFWNTAATKKELSYYVIENLNCLIEKKELCPPEKVFSDNDSTARYLVLRLVFCWYASAENLICFRDEEADEYGFYCNLGPLTTSTEGMTEAIFEFFRSIPVEEGEEPCLIIFLPDDPLRLYFEFKDNDRDELEIVWDEAKVVSMIEALSQAEFDHIFL